MNEDLFFEEDIQMSEIQLQKQNKITNILERIYNKKGFDLPYFYNAFEDNLYFMNNSLYEKVGLNLEDINESTILSVINRLNKKLILK